MDSMFAFRGFWHAWDNGTYAHARESVYAIR